MTEFVRSPSDDHLLLRELAHRVNNEFTSIVNTISRAASRSPSPEVKAALNEATEMLHNYVDVHSALKMPEPHTQVDAAEYLHRLCAVMRRSKLEQSGIGLMLNSARLTLGSARCWYLGLIVYELVTNAVRHSFAGRGGEVRVALQCTDEFVECKVGTMGRVRRVFGKAKDSRSLRAWQMNLAGSCGISPNRMDGCQFLSFH